MNTMINIQNYSPDNIWFTSDTHFFHEGIIKFCGRPFKHILEMNETLIQNWNDVVPEDGIVFHLGDFCLGGSQAWKDVRAKLHGQIYLILGNHDVKNMRPGYAQLFEHVTQQMIIQADGQEIILNHNPFLAYGGSYRDVWQLFGHVHSGPLSTTGLDLPRLKMLFPLQYDVGVDNNDFRPISFYDVKAKIEAQVEDARAASGLKDIGETGVERRIIFLDPAVLPTSTAQKVAYKRLKTASNDIVEIYAKKGESLKEKIGRSVALLSGNVRYVYVGTQPLDDFRCVMVDKATGLTEANVDTAIQILE